MPLKEGSSEETISWNIAGLLKEGNSPKSAEAIAYKKAGRSSNKDAAVTTVRVAVFDRSDFYAPTELGKTRSITPEGYLLCEGVAIARTGTQTYAAHELPGLKPNGSGQIIVERPPEEVFRPEALASFVGKSVTVEHPNSFVDPTTYKEHEVGQIHNVRRGTGIEDDVVLADLLIKDPGAIAHANRDFPEVSGGYDSDYDQTEPGHAIQRNIIGNHVALVDRGRAGPRCAIRDHQPKSELPMSGKKVGVVDRLLGVLNAVKNKDQAALDAITTDESMEEPVESTDRKAMDARMSKVFDWVEDRMAKDAKEEEEKKEKERKESEDKKVADAVLSAETTAAPDLGKLYTGDSLTTVFSRAEILAPGVKIPTSDSISTRGVVENLMLTALKTADATEAGHAAIAPFLMGRELSTFTTKDSLALAGVFNGAAELMRQRNNNGTQPVRMTTRDFGKPTSIADIQKAQNEFWNKQTG